MDQDFLLPSAPRTQRNPVRPKQAKEASNGVFPFAHRSTDLTFDSLSGPPSSDPPLFSSDDFQPGLENYTSPLTGTGTGTATSSSTNVGGEGHAGTAKKRRYRGTWWGEKVECSKNKKRTRTAFKNKRDMDSGVWMMSSDDASNTLSSDVVFGDEMSALVGNEGKQEVQVNGKSPVRPNMRDAPCSAMALQSEQPRTIVNTDRVRETEAQRHARSAVNRCLEDGNDNVDLS